MRKAVCSGILFITILSILSGCVGSKSTEVVGNKNVTIADKNNSEVVEVNKVDVKANTQFNGNTQFAFEIFSRINEKDRDKNIFISPLSISTALSMALQGAETTTKEGMMKTLKYDAIELDAVNRNYKNLLTILGSADKGIQLDINNSIWVREGKKVKDEFINVNKDVFGAYVSPLDFSMPDAAIKINNWVAASTRNKINKIVEPSISPDVLMYILNAVYFKGEWTEKFDKNLTVFKDFHSGNGDKKEVRMMNKKSDIEYGEKDDLKVVRLPYGDGKTSMYFVLPEENVSINDFIKGLDEGKWKDIKDSISKADDVQLNIPRFKMEYDVNNMTEVLSFMGMKEAFGVNADFTGIGDGGLYISNIKHKAFVEVNEEGSEASGVTGLEVSLTSLNLNPPSFIADRPFLFLITEDTTGTILFMGKMYDVNGL